MANNTQQIRIESILGGESPTSHFAAANQFFTSLNIDPGQPTNDSVGKSSGLLRPVNVNRISSETLTGAPMWIKRDPKDLVSYVYGANGSVYSYNINTGVFSGLGDLNDGGTASGNGAAYYDNYMYFSRDTTVARYGPLNGTPAFTDDYWVTTLSKTALQDTAYPTEGITGLELPNHILHRHSDGRLYIADVVGNQGTIHYIQTRKTTVEGDTDDGSTYSKVQVGFGLVPTAIESYGNNLVIAFCEIGKDVGTKGSATRSMNAKIAFWDTTSQNVNSITWSEYPDPVVTAMKNINGVLYVFSGPEATRGCRITRFVGGYTFEEVQYLTDLQIQSPFPGAVDGTGNRLLFGTHVDNNLSIASNFNDSGAVISMGLQNGALGQGIFKVMGTTGSSASVTSLSLLGKAFEFDAPDIGWSTGATGGGANGYDRQTGNYSTAPTYLLSQNYVIGQPFKITKIRIPFINGVTANTSVTVSAWIDSTPNNSANSSTSSIDTITSTKYANKKSVVLRPTSLTGEYSFVLQLEWTGTALAVVGLPIVIEYEPIDD